MGKLLIDKLNPAQQDLSYFDSKYNLLHLAAEGGAYELVKLLLERGVRIDSLDEHDKNCLDIAIENEHKDVIKVLLNDSNWQKLFRKFTQQDTKNKPHNKKIDKSLESKQFAEMIHKKMWDMIQIVLDRCEIKNTSYTDKCYDFTVIDPVEFKDLNRHPLMMIANSGQEQLLTHSTVRTLLELKWRLIPRLAYSFNIILHLAFLILFSLYSFDLSEIDRKPENNNQNAQDDNLNSAYSPYLLSLMSLIAFMMLLKLVLTGIFGYFFKIETWIGITTIVLSFLSVTYQDLALKIAFCSISLIFIYLQFALLIQKVRFFGLYVLAFRGTIKNSAKFFPIFLLIYAGFVLSFRVRTATSDIPYFNDTAPEVFIKGLTLMLGNFNDDQMGLKSSVINYILYALFILILSIIILNLFVGIAVGEITQLLAVATVQQISLRIIFVIQVQFSIKFTRKICLLDRIFKMTFGYYDYNRDEPKVIILIDKIITRLRIKLSKSNPKINLVDPISRLDDKLDVLMAYFEVEQAKLKRAMLNQLGYIHTKMNYSQIRLEESLKDSTRRTQNKMESFKGVSNSQGGLATSARSSSASSSSSPETFYLNEKFDSFNSLLVNMFQSFDYNQFHQNVKLLNYLKMINENTNELRDNKMAMMTNFSMFNDRLLILEANLASLIVKLDKIDSLNNEFSYKLNLLCSHLNDKYY